MSSPDPILSPAADAFAEFLSRRELDESLDFEEFCASRPELASKLRALFASWHTMNRALDEARDGRDLRDAAGRLFAELEESAPRRPRYEPRDEIGRGGMGVVRRVWDRPLRRPLAMKVMRETEPCADSTARNRALSRFLEEAQITGQLQHPGIVPVHDLGVDESGRAFFTMSLIEGRSFGEIIAAVRSGDEGWTLTRAVGVILRVCEAVAFAHGRGVIHRDLKPSNVMVGPFGETYVMDWGLARALDRHDPPANAPRSNPTAPASTIRSVRQDAHDQDADSPLVTENGDVVGTPAYMAPEQARGDVEEVGPQADVYSIGAMLYHLLAREVPFGTTHDVLARLLSGPPRPLLDVARDVPFELIAICERAMARQPKSRYPDVRSLAHDLRAFLEVRVVRAYETGTIAILRKWVKRNRALATATAAAVFAMVAGVVVSLVLMRNSDAHASAAEANFRRAYGAFDKLGELGTTILADTPQMDATRRELLDEVLAFHQGFLDANRDDPRLREDIARTHRRIGHLELDRGQLAAAEAALLRSAEQMVPLAAAAPERRDLQLELARSHGALGAVARTRGDHERAAAWYRSARDVLDDLASRAPEDAEVAAVRADVLSDAATSFDEQQRHEPALALRVEALDTMKKLVERNPLDREHRARLASGRRVIAFTLRNLGRLREAEAEYQAALSILGELAAETPASRTLRIREARTRNSLGLVRHQLRNLDGAQQSLERSIELWRRLIVDFPESPTYRAERGGNLSNLARVLISLDQLPAALDAAERGQAEKRIALQAAPDHAAFQDYLRNGQAVLCDVLLGLGRHVDAAVAAEDLVPMAPGRAEQCFEAALVLCRCAAAVAADSAAFAEYSGRAVELVRTARAKGWDDVYRLAGSPFEFIHQSEAFLGLRAELRALYRRELRAVEGESMAIEPHSAGLETARQELGPSWSDGWHLLVRAGAVGDSLDLVARPARRGRHRVRLHLTGSFDFGVLQVAVNGCPVASRLDTYRPRVTRLDPVDLGVHDVSTTLALRIEVVDVNPRSQGSGTFFGVDCIALEPEPDDR